MYKAISNEIIRKFHPCYDPSKFITDENEELPVKDWIQKYRDVVPAKDILWLLLRKEFLSEKDLRLFAVWCAREALKLVENPDERIVEACNVAEKYANGEATMDELDAAYIAADDVADAEYYAIRTVFYYIDTYYIDYYAAISAAYATANTALVAVDASAYAAYYSASAVSDDADAAYDATRDAQLDQLLTYF
jgi:hypothetical protein